MKNEVLFDQKWIKFLRRDWLFKHLPFTEFVLASGSLALGNVRPESDFDVIVGVRQGRIFTVRFFCWLIFGMFGWRAVHKGNNSKKWRDKICFNHFVTPAAYRLSPPHKEYWKNLYQNLVPVYGEPEVIQKFFDANADWLQERRMYITDKRHVYKKKGFLKRFWEWRWFGIWADWTEKLLKAVQTMRIENSIKKQSGYKPRIIYNDNELEFHSDTKRIELYIKNKL